jgi:dTDP-glucose 4,6-dehydratase
MTGAAGFIGSHFVRHMLEAPGKDGSRTRVTVVDSLTYAANQANLTVSDPRLTFIRGNVCDASLLMEVLPGHEAVVHFAAETHVDNSLSDAAPFAMTNVVGTQTMLECSLAAGVEVFVQVSTDEVYGSADTGSRVETSPLLPNSPYAASKASADLFARAYWRSHGLDVRIARCTNTYGPCQYIEKLIPLFVTNLLDGERVPLYGDGRNTREWLHVDDHCRAIKLILEKGAAGEIYNIGPGTPMTNLELTATLLRLCGAGWDSVMRVTDRKGHDLRYSLDSTKIRTRLGFLPEVPFETGIAEVVRWYRDNRWWWEPAKKQRAAGPLTQPGSAPVRSGAHGRHGWARAESR